MVMMLAAAEPVTGLGGAVGKLVHHPRLAHRAQGAVDGGETNRAVASPQAKVDLLRRRIVWLAGELLQHQHPIAARLDSSRGEPVGELLPRRGGRCHRRVSYLSCENENH